MKKARNVVQIKQTGLVVRCKDKETASDFLLAFGPTPPAIQEFHNKALSQMAEDLDREIIASCKIPKECLECQKPKTANEVKLR